MVDTVHYTFFGVYEVHIVAECEILVVIGYRASKSVNFCVKKIEM